jgi:hypothetical protein
LSCGRPNLLRKRFKDFFRERFFNLSTQAQIIALRLEIHDPLQGENGLDIINILSVNADSDLPAAPAQQTAYFIVTTGHYKSTALSAGATSADYVDAPLQLSDAQLSALIDQYGTRAACKAFKRIASTLGPQLMLKSNSDGAEKEEYAALLDVWKYYDNLANGCEDTEDENTGLNSGRVLSSVKPCINGGLL